MIGYRVRDFRMAYGLTQEKLAEAAELPMLYVRHIERWPYLVQDFVRIPFQLIPPSTNRGVFCSLKGTHIFCYYFLRRGK